MLFKVRLADRARKNFIARCQSYDAPRLKNETFPADVKAETDISYIGDGQDAHKLDIYTPFNVEGSREAFILIHGGAFVYGFKELDKLFGMELAKKAGIPVVNINYTLMPQGSLETQLNDIFIAMNFVSKKYGFDKLHLTGDSAGAYLAYITAVAARNRHIAHSLWVFEKLRPKVESAGLICGCYEINPNGFPGVFFEKQNQNKRLPDVVYDIKNLAYRMGSLRAVLITGEDDDPVIRKDNYKFKAILDELGIDTKLYDAENKDGRKMVHVFPISSPYSPEGARAIELIAENAVGRR